MSTQPGQQPKEEKPPIGFYALMTTVGVCLGAVIIYLIASYFAK